jgi:hypothetical protein
MSTRDRISLKSTNPSQAALRLMSDLKELKTDPPEVIFIKIENSTLFYRIILNILQGS